MWFFVGFTKWRPGFEPGSGHVGFVVNVASLGQIFSVYSGIPLNHFTVYSTFIIRGLVQ
jgi:hypothetical protein